MTTQITSDYFRSFIQCLLIIIPGYYNTISFGNLNQYVNAKTFFSGNTIVFMESKNVHTKL